MKILNGTALAKKIKSVLAIEIDYLVKRYGRAPKLCIVLAGDDPASVSYVKSKQKSCNEIGILCDLNILPYSTSQDELLALIEILNNDPGVDGILVQLPLPKHIDQNVILQALDYKKDVDGLHPMNVGLLNRSGEAIIPCTPKGILSLLKAEDISITGKHCVVIGRSNLVGKPMAQLMLRENASVTVCHSKTRDLAYLTRQGEILIIAIGHPNLLNADMLKEGAVVVDVGINSVDGKLVGDLYNSIDVEDIEKKAAAITPVPGGVGPMTIASLLENVVEIYKKRCAV
ncbi:MAG: bifunctional methylenetetrahydrofolate dehydrogenase/methenyltetrahydrofolate cyclohydrolase FolD [Bacteroidetes bacterium]|nr:bifunctional methylenetetrahydrofolate dehydrogenase/methenyltetrahydrofolate cyclohydrolase FolD [Bacteroidota bacterium]MCL2302338.1 bifunctional methylenetetrahydrofolate dehydrogenase/methenyltetrahydrofolate cyclohydrolase FolD [Lentimicrobiaceae bacterium]